MDADTKTQLKNLRLLAFLGGSTYFRGTFA